MGWSPSKFNFWLEYQKERDNTVADVLSQITTHLGPEAVQSILDGVALGAYQSTEGDDPAMVEGDQEIEKEVCVTAGWVLVEMHVTNWATAQREDPKLDAVLHWLVTKKKTDVRTLLGSMLPVKRAEQYGGITKISWSSKMPSIYAPHPKGRMRIYYSL